MIYVFESTILSWITIAWVAVQQVVYNVNPVDAVVFYSQAIFLLGLLFSMLVFKFSEYQKVLFTVQFSAFLFYLHIIDQSFSYYLMPSTQGYTCTNHPHSDAYEHIFFGMKPKELNIVFSSVSLAFIFVHVLLALASHVEKIAEDVLWGECTLVLIAVAHVYVGSLDQMAWYAVLLLMMLVLYVLHYMVYLIVYSVPEFQSALLGRILTLSRVIILLLLAINTYVYLVIHSHQWIAWSYIPIAVLVLTVTTIHYLDRLGETESSGEEPKNNLWKKYR